MINNITRPHKYSSCSRPFNPSFSSLSPKIPEKIKGENVLSALILEILLVHIQTKGL